MRILYVAKHGSGGNDDEGAIAYALEQLGHEVINVQESTLMVKSPVSGVEGVFSLRRSNEFDFCLFHKWGNFEQIWNVECPKVFWYFDLVDWPLDATLASRCEARKRWMAEVTPLVDLGFCTDGDWVHRYNFEQAAGRQAIDLGPKLHVLRQGADERVVGFGKEQERDIDVLFVGGVKGCGVQRESFVLDLKKMYEGRFRWVAKDCYREALRDLVARSKVVVCPDSPVTWRYWSNRVYVLGGFGACMLHPLCGGIAAARDSIDWFVAGPCSYLNREQLFSRLEYLLKDSATTDRERVSVMTLNDVKNRHLYRHRCEKLVRVVKEKLGI